MPLSLLKGNTKYGLNPSLKPDKKLLQFFKNARVAKEDHENNILRILMEIEVKKGS